MIESEEAKNADWCGLKTFKMDKGVKNRGSNILHRLNLASKGHHQVSGLLRKSSNCKELSPDSVEVQKSQSLYTENNCIEMFIESPNLKKVLRTCPESNESLNFSVDRLPVQSGSSGVTVNPCRTDTAVNDRNFDQSCKDEVNEDQNDCETLYTDDCTDTEDVAVIGSSVHRKYFKLYDQRASIPMKQAECRYGLPRISESASRNDAPRHDFPADLWNILPSRERYSLRQLKNLRGIPPVQMLPPDNIFLFSSSRHLIILR